MNDIKQINFQLSDDKDSFLHGLYEDDFFDTKKFRELIISIKQLKNDEELLLIIWKKYNDCIWESFLSNLINRVYLLMNIEWDLREYGKKLNINKMEYSEYIWELAYELQSLFAWWEKDYFWNDYQ